jgi:hypothetical protein
MILLIIQRVMNCFGKVPPLVEGSLLTAWNPCRAPTVRQQATLHRGSPVRTRRRPGLSPFFTAAIND